MATRRQASENRTATRPPREPAARKLRAAGTPAPSASETAYARLMDEIVDGVLRPGERVTEAEVARRVGLGKTPVREALRRLVFEGLVLLQPRNGYKVAPVTLRGVEELCGLRLIVEPAAAALAAGNLTTAQLDELDELARVSYDAADRDSVRDYLRVNREFHGLIVSACGNGRLAALVDQLHFQSYRIFQVQLIHYPASTVHTRLHEDLVKALRAGDAARARELSEKEIGASQHFIVASLLRSPALRSVALA
jgi:DNA-binding GntR family transcriptional regulator